MIYSHQGLTYGGLLIEHSTRLVEVVESLKAILHYYEQERIEWVQLRTIPSVYREDHSDEMSYLLFKTEAQMLRCDVLAIVKPDQANYSRDRKAGIKRGEKHGLIVKEEEDLSGFWNDLLIPMLKSKYKTKPVHSLEEIMHLKGHFPKKIRQFNVYHEDKMVAGTTIFETTMVARSQYISSDDSKNNLGSLDWLHHQLLENVFADKPYFDFGASNLDSGQKINDGLLYWKEGFGSRVIPHRFYTIRTSDHEKLKDIFV